MPPLPIALLHSLKDDFKNYPVFIETGTLFADTIRTMEPVFEKLYSIEFDERLHNNAKSRYSNSKMNFLLGDSSIVFSTFLPSISDNVVFFLDGH
jgi:hypothetical protein